MSKHKPTIKRTIKSICLGKFLQSIMKTSLTQFIFSKVCCFKHIILKAFRWIRLKYVNHSLKIFYFRHSNNIEVAAWNYKSPIAKILDGNTLKMKATSPVLVIKNKKKYFQLVLAWMRTLVLCARLGRK